MIRPWMKRPTEIANLLNPAFCSLLLKEGCSGYAQGAGMGLPLSLCFILLPLVLHKPTRQALPRSTATRLHSWIHRNQRLQIGFSRRAQELVPHTWEAVALGVNAGLLSVSTSTGYLSSCRQTGRHIPDWPVDSEPANCLKASSFVGRWLARVGEESTVYAMLGVKP